MNRKGAEMESLERARQKNEEEKNRIEQSVSWNDVTEEEEEEEVDQPTDEDFEMEVTPAQSLSEVTPAPSSPEVTPAPSSSKKRRKLAATVQIEG